MLNLEIDTRSQVPIYIQITNQIRHLIATEVLKPGDQLPTVRQVAADLRVNFNTVARAYRQLDDAGIISTQLGRGTFILELESHERSEELRRRDLLHLTLEFIHDVSELEFSPEELENTLKPFLDSWKAEGQPPGFDTLKQ